MKILKIAFSVVLASAFFLLGIVGSSHASSAEPRITITKFQYGQNDKPSHDVIETGTLTNTEHLVPMAGVTYRITELVDGEKTSTTWERTTDASGIVNLTTADGLVQGNYVVEELPNAKIPVAMAPLTINLPFHIINQPGEFWWMHIYPKSISQGTTKPDNPAVNPQPHQDDGQPLMAGQIEILKTDRVSKQALKGVGFKLATSLKKLEHGKYYQRNGHDYALKTNRDGRLVFKELPLGTYYIKETANLKGYHLLDDPIKVVVTSEKWQQSINVTNEKTWLQKMLDSLYPSTDSDDPTDDGKRGDGKHKPDNKDSSAYDIVKRAVFPPTGELILPIVFVVAGLLIIGLAWLVKRKR